MDLEKQKKYAWIMIGVSILWAGVLTLAVVLIERRRSRKFAAYCQDWHNHSLYPEVTGLDKDEELEDAQSDWDRDLGII